MLKDTIDLFKTMTTEEVKDGIFGIGLVVAFYILIWIGICF